MIEPIGPVAGADEHRANRPALRHHVPAVGHGAAPLGSLPAGTAGGAVYRPRECRCRGLAIAGQMKANEALKRSASIAFGSCI
jgi:hypothetical protein